MSVCVSVLFDCEKFSLIFSDCRSLCTNVVVFVNDSNQLMAVLQLFPGTSTLNNYLIQLQGGVGSLSHEQ